MHVVFMISLTFAILMVIAHTVVFKKSIWIFENYFSTKKYLDTDDLATIWNSLIDSVYLKQKDVPIKYKRSFLFRPNKSNLKLFMKLIWELSAICQNASADYFMNCGSLIGSYRHHSMIPWDLDFDMAISHKHKDTFMRSYAQFKNSTFFLRHKYDEQYKYIAKRHPSIYSDVMFYKDINKTHFGIAKGINKLFVFPTVLRPFGPLMIPAPRHPKEYLQEQYQYEWTSLMNNCYNSRTKQNVSCTEMIPFYPFVKRTPGKELLVYNGSVVYENIVLDDH